MQGLKVIFAQVGCVVPCNPAQICQAKLRGEISYGMLCSAAEMSWADSADSLVELPGAYGGVRV